MSGEDDTAASERESGQFRPFKLPESWVIGWRRIDEDHARILAIINGCLAHADGQDVPDFDDRFSRLSDELRSHFAVEEELMDQIAYPGLKWHAAHHDAWIGKVGTLHHACIKKGRASYEDILTCYDQVLADIVKADLVLQGYLAETGLARARTQDRAP